MRIIHKGLFLIAIPLLVELGFLIALLISLGQAEHELDERAESLEMVARSRVVASSVHDAFLQAGFYNVMKDDASREKYTKRLAEIKKSINELFDMMGKNPKYDRVVPEMHECWDDIFSILDRAQVIMESGKRVDQLEIVMMAEQLNQRSETIADLFHQIILKDDDILGKDVQERTQSARNGMRMLVYSGVAINILIAVLLLRWFSTSISNRIGSVIDNTLKMERGEELNPVTTGSDEIAELDAIFHQAANSLKEASDREKAIFDNAVDVICSLDSSGKITRMNIAFEKALGYRVEELADRHLIEFVAPEEQGIAFDYLQKVREKFQSSHTQEIRMNSESGITRDFMWSSKWEPTQGAYYCVAHDVTERKELETAKQEFVAMVSHDLRSPLTSMRVSLGLFLNGAFGEPEPKAKKRLVAMDESLERLIRLINNLLDIEKLDAGKMELNLSVQLSSAMIADAMESVRGMAEEQKVELRVVAKDLLVFADKDRIVQVLVNFLSNAIKFSPPKSTVEIRSLERGDFVEFRVIDKGKGIPENMRQQIFEKFKQVDAQGAIEKKGTGLGLAICKNIIDTHGGQIGVDSEVDRGSQFWFRLRKSD